jgi:hypothetical protein
MLSQTIKLFLRSITLPIIVRVVKEGGAHAHSVKVRLTSYFSAALKKFSQTNTSLGYVKYSVDFFHLGTEISPP